MWFFLPRIRILVARFVDGKLVVTAAEASVRAEDEIPIGISASTVKEYASAYTWLEGFEELAEGKTKTEFFIFTSESDAILLGYGPRWSVFVRV